MKRLLVIAGLVILIMVSCTARVVHFGSDIMAHTSHGIMIDEFDFSEDVHVTTRVNGQMVSDNIVAIRALEAELEALDFELESFELEDFSIHFSDDAIFLEAMGEEMVISAELNDELPTLHFEVGGDGTGR